MASRPRLGKGGGSQFKLHAEGGVDASVTVNPSINFEYVREKVNGKVMERHAFVGRMVVGGVVGLNYGDLFAFTATSNTERIGDAFFCTNVVAKYAYKVPTKVKEKGKTVTKTVTKYVTRTFVQSVSPDPEFPKVRIIRGAASRR